MAELRWGLLFVGLILLAAIYLYTRHKPKIPDHLASMRARLQPVINDDASQPEVSEVPELSDSMPDSIPDSESALESGSDSMVIAIRLMARGRMGFPGEKLILALREQGLRHGQFGIFHRMNEDESHSLFSVASLIEPGSFDLSHVKTDEFPGVSMFLVLPGPDDAVDIFDDMLTIGRNLSQNLDGELLDEHGNRLSIQRERYLREEVIQFQHQHPLI